MTDNGAPTPGPNRALLIEEARVSPLATKRRLLASGIQPEELDLPSLEALVWAEIGLNNLPQAEALFDELSVRVDSDQATAEDQAAIGYLEGVLRLAQGLPTRAKLTLESLASVEGDSSLAAKALLAIVATEAGDDDGALQAYRAAIESARQAEKNQSLCQLLNNRAVLHMTRGRFSDAAQDLDEAEMFGKHENALWQAIVTHNRGSLAARLGELPDALEQFRSARDRLRSGGPHVLGPALMDQGQLLLDAGLLDEADYAVGQAEELYRRASAPARELDALRLRIRVAGAAGAWADAAAHSARALELAEANGLADRTIVFRQMQEACALVELAGRAVDDEVQAIEADRIAAGVDAEMAIDAGLLLGRTGHVSAAIACLEHGRDSDGATSALSVLHRSVADAELLRLRGNGGAVIQVARDGLAEATSNSVALGVTEFRSLASRRLGQLLEAGTAAAIAEQDPVVAVELIEAERAISLAAEPRITAAERSLVAQIRSEVADRASGSTPDHALMLSYQRQAELEFELRQSRREQSGSEALAQQLAASTLSTTFFYLAAAHGAAVCLLRAPDAEPVVVDLGEIAPIERSIRSTSLILQADADERADWSSKSAVGRLREQLQPVLARMEQLTTAVVVAEQPFDAVPWPLLTGCAISQVQSAGQWSSISGPEPDLSELTVIAGPRLKHVDQEIDAIVELMPSATILTGTRATTAAAVAALETASFVHFATHGNFRTDNALMSSLELSDGPLTFWDLMQASRVPPHIVFSACDVGRKAPQAALGLGAILFERGCSALVAARGPANDRATAGLMAEMYRALQAGQDLASALRLAQHEHQAEASLAQFGTFGRTHAIKSF